MVQWSVGTKVTSDPPALQIQPTPNLLFSEQMDSSLFPFTAVCSFTVWRSSYKGRQHGPASSHTHTDTQRPLCWQQQQTHAVWSRLGLAPKNKTRGMFSLEVESCHCLRSGFVAGGTSAPLWNSHPYFLITSPQLKATIRKYFFPHSLFLFNHLFPL